MTVYKIDTVINFGKHKGETVGKVLETDPEWLGWAEDTIDWFELDEEAEALLDEAVYAGIEWD